MKEKNVNPYSTLYDGNNAIKEYYKLKQMLCLTDAEWEMVRNNDRCREYYKSDNQCGLYGYIKTVA